MLSTPWPDSRGAVATSLQYLAVFCRRCLQLCNRSAVSCSILPSLPSTLLQTLTRLWFGCDCVWARSRLHEKAIPQSTGPLLGLVRSAAPRRACPIPEHFHSTLPRPLRVQEATARASAGWAILTGAIMTPHGVCRSMRVPGPSFCQRGGYASINSIGFGRIDRGGTYSV